MTRTLFAAATATLVIGLTVVGASPQAPTPAPASAAEREAAGRKLIQTICGGCHASSSILGEHRTRHDWEEVLAWMTDEGAVMTDEEYAQLMQFLGVRYGLVAVNSAEPDEVAAVLELTDAQKDRLVAARTSGAVFKGLDDLAAAVGVAPAALEARRDRVVFTAD